MKWVVTIACAALLSSCAGHAGERPATEGSDSAASKVVWEKTIKGGQWNRAWVNHDDSLRSDTCRGWSHHVRTIDARQTYLDLPQNKQCFGKIRDGILGAIPRQQLENMLERGGFPLTYKMTIGEDGIPVKVQFGTRNSNNMKLFYTDAMILSMDSVVRSQRFLPLDGFETGPFEAHSGIGKELAKTYLTDTNYY